MPKTSMTSREIELIQKIGRQISSELDMNKLLHSIVKQIDDFLHYSYCSILLKEGNNLVIRAVSEFPDDILGKRIPIGKGITGRCALSGKEILVPDISKCDFFISFSKENFQSELAVPIMYKGKVIGVLDTQDIKKNFYTERDVRILKILCTQVASAIRNAQIHRQLELVQRIGIQLVSVMNLSEILSIIVRETMYTLHYDSCAIFLKEGDAIVLHAVSGIPEDKLGMKIPIGKGITGKCAESKDLINIGDVSCSKDYIPSGLKGVKSEIASPIIYGDELLGVLTIESKVKNAFDEEDIRLLSILTSQISVAIRNAKLYAEIEKLAITDPLTGLYNYRYFYQKLAQEMGRAERYKRPLSLVLIDIDDFKLINDTYGHLEGDHVLKTAARLISKNIRKFHEPTMTKEIVYIDTVARYGGDEFIIILPESRLEGAVASAERLRRLIEENLAQTALLIGSDETLRNITASFGITSYKKGEKTEEIIKRVDRAMYRAKEMGKNRIFYIE